MPLDLGDYQGGWTGKDILPNSDIVARLLFLAQESAFRMLAKPSFLAPNAKAQDSLPMSFSGSSTTEVIEI
jgi:hypothetical protein